jgi:23S rRNA pseudouridine1911/1915/1917 synthase
VAVEHRFELPPEAKGERLDQVLVRLFPDQSRAALQRWVKEGRVEAALAGVPIEAAKLKPAFKVPGPLRLVVRAPVDRPVALRPEALAGVVYLHRDDDLVVVAKPAPMVVYPSPGHSGGTLVNALLHEGGPLSVLGGAERPGVVHRLDRDTSGVIVLARTDAAHRELCRQFKAREVDKRYLAIVRGAPREDRFDVDLPIARSPHDRQKMAVQQDGRAARTAFVVRERFARHALVECFPQTGRTHQLRVHLHARGLPILCDSLYAPEPSVSAEDLVRSRGAGGDRAAAAEPLLARHALHAAELAFTHPRTGERVRFAAPLPEDLARVLALLRNPPPMK